jgi:hypothetical protein
MAVHILGFLELILVALVMGNAAGSRWLFMPAMQKLPPVHFATMAQATLSTLGKLMPVLMALTLALAIPLLLYLRQEGEAWRFWATVSGEGFGVAVLVTSLTMNVSVTRDLMQWDPKGPPANWTQYRDRWRQYHSLRAGFAVLALASHVAAVA